MKTDGDSPIGVIDGYYAEDAISSGKTGLTKRELMAIEFTKTLLGLRHYDNMPIYDLRKNTYNPSDDFNQFTSQQQADDLRKQEIEIMLEKVMYVVDNLITALNKKP